jgi:hypothetical protein
VRALSLPRATHSDTAAALQRCSSSVTLLPRALQRKLASWPAARFASSCLMSLAYWYLLICLALVSLDGSFRFGVDIALCYLKLLRVMRTFVVSPPYATSALALRRPLRALTVRLPYIDTEKTYLLSFLCVRHRGIFALRPTVRCSAYGVRNFCRVADDSACAACLACVRALPFTGTSSS